MFEPIEGVLRDTTGYRGVVDMNSTGIEIHRNHSDNVTRTTTHDTRPYYVKIASGKNAVDFSLTEEEMLGLFQAFLNIHDDIERVKNG